VKTPFFKINIMADIKEFSSQLSELYRQRTSWNDKLSKYNDDLSKAKFGKRASIRKAIRNVEQQIKGIDRQVDDVNRKIKQLEKVENDEILAKQGINAGAGRMEAIGGMIGSTAQLAGSLMGAGGLSAIGVGKQQAKAEQSKTEAIISTNQTTQETTKKNTTLYIIIGVVAVVILFMFKKK
jgi:hypothetical protein